MKYYLLAAFALIASLAIAEMPYDVHVGYGSPDSARDCDTIGELYRDITNDALYVCEATGTPGTWVAYSLGASTTLNFLTTGTIRGMIDVVATTGTTDSPSADEMRGSFHTADNTGVVTYTLPSAVQGMSACFYDLDGTAIITIEIDGSDVINLDGTALDAGDTIDSPGARGDYICLLAIDTTNWLTLGRSGTWVDGGAT